MEFVAAADIVDQEQHQIKGRVLIIEDDPMIRKYLSLVMSRLHEVDGVESGEEALEAIAENDYDILLLDVMMPGLSGYDVLDILRSDPDTADLPVILITALVDPRDVVEGLEHGANDYVTKPVESAEIIARVNTQLKLKRLIDERKQHIAKLESAESLRKQFSRIASHDLKNPLHNLRLAEHLLRDEARKNPRIVQILDMIDVTVDNMETIIHDFVDMVDIQSDNITLNMGALSLRDVVLNVFLQYEIAAEAKHIHLQLDSVNGYVLADAARMIQVVGNLLSNALKYSPHDSTVKIWTEAQGENLRLCVADEGPGILPKEQDLLFKEFTRLSNRPTGGETSTGMGLWIVKHLIELQGGTAGAYFPEEGGSVFYVELTKIDVSSKNSD